MSDVTKEKRQLKIKTGAVTRLWKEVGLYSKEQEEHEAKVEKMLAEGGAEEWNIKNGRKMADESKRMVADTQNRLTSAVAELRDLVVYARSHPDDFQESEELHAAEAALNESNI